MSDWLRSDGGFRGQVLGRLIVTWCINGEGAPPIDRCFVTDREGRSYRGIAILLRPWRRNQHGERRRGAALVLGWRK